MSTDEIMKPVERTIAVENFSSQVSLNFLIFALLLDVAYRSWFRNEAPWDLIGLVIVSSGLSTLFQSRQQVWGRGMLWTITLIGLVSAILAAIIAAILSQTKVM